MNIVNHNRISFAKTNIDTVLQRVSIIKRLFPNVESIAEICCGDCQRQFDIYKNHFNIKSYRGLDIDPIIVKKNNEKNINCICGNALENNIMQKFLDFDIIFFGPPLSDNCDGHTILKFNKVYPSFFDFLNLMFVELKYNGIINCICPRDTTFGDITWLYKEIKIKEPKLSLPIINYSYSNKTGNDEIHELRLKYVELWFSKNHDNLWEILKLGIQENL